MGPGEATPAFGRVRAAFALLQKERLRGPVFYKGWQLSPRAKPAAVSPASEDKNRYSGPHDGRGGVLVKTPGFQWDPEDCPLAGKVHRKETHTAPAMQQRASLALSRAEGTCRQPSRLPEGGKHSP